MKILYLTTAVDENKYEEALKQGVVANPSNQNFHLNLIKALKQEHDVLVVSSRPALAKTFSKKEKKDDFFYPFYINIPFIKVFTLAFCTKNPVRDFNPDCIVVDALNVTLLKVANNMKRTLKKPLIGIVTDNPVNLSNTSNYYIQNVFKEVTHADGYIALTEGLHRLFNLANKPHFVFPGILENKDKTERVVEPYAFFAGALYARYGVNELIETFKDKKAPYPLYIAGHGPLSKALETLNHPNIKYLGVLSPKTASDYASKAAVAINPRPVDSQIDLFSVPSKLISYIETANVVLSTKNDIIYPLVGDNTYWVDSFTKEVGLAALNEIKRKYSHYQERGQKASASLREHLSNDKFLALFKELTQQL